MDRGADALAEGAETGFYGDRGLHPVYIAQPVEKF